ncbi:PREDICTED: putative nuclease HARBI1 isoform X1 [Nelumbo nucifera]|uniref:Nuclease HARBI1 isoform X1 n=1 Tax=Nelumbo nucifera TaxID=4432 RepID=A0A1U8B3H8_NELNU|nr:PREDICTED: putative nuclease HARBI1 isoform X1 [Nelumbo nucifera]
MDGNRMDSSVSPLCQKRAMVEDCEEEERHEKIFVSSIMLLTTMAAWYHRKSIVKEMPADKAEKNVERQSVFETLFSETYCMEQLHISKQSFLKLCTILCEKGGLVETKNVPVKEAVAMFLHILAQNLKYRLIKVTYCRSVETISRQFNRVLRAVMKLSKDFLRSYEPKLQGQEAEKWKWFEGCLGALGRTFIPLNVPLEDRSRYRNKKGEISTNVLVVCSPEMKIMYVLPGWEGSASDSQVLQDALTRRDHLHVPSDKYFLADVIYANGPGFLAPYQGTRYDLKEWAGNVPTNYKELFNLRHSTAMNVIERTFKLLKRRWGILQTTSFFDLKTQIRIISACCILHNFILDEQPDDLLLQDIDHELEAELVPKNADEPGDEIACVQATSQWAEFRDKLAMEMFETFQGQQGYENEF